MESTEDSVHRKLYKCVGPVASSVGFSATYAGRKRPPIASLLENWKMMVDDGFGKYVQLWRNHLFFKTVPDRMREDNLELMGVTDADYLSNFIATPPSHVISQEKFATFLNACPFKNELRHYGFGDIIPGPADPADEG